MLRQNNETLHYAMIYVVQVQSGRGSTMTKTAIARILKKHFQLDSFRVASWTAGLSPLSCSSSVASILLFFFD